MSALSAHQLMERLAQIPQLEELLLAAHTTGDHPTAEEMAAAIGLDVDLIGDLTEQLVELGLVESEQSQAREVVLTPRGRSLAIQLQDSYSNGARRTEAIRRGVLESFGRKPRASSLELAQAWPGRELDPAPTHEEIADAYEFLSGRDLIKAQGTWQGVWLGIRLTPTGRDALEGRHRLVTAQPATSINDHSDRSQTFNQQGATIGAVSSGDHNTVSGTVTIPTQSLKQIRQALTDALAHVERLPAEHQQPVREALEDADSVAAQESPRPGALRRLLGAASTAAGSAVGNTAGQVIVSLMSSAAALV